MAQPCWTSLDPLVVNDGVLDIGHGDWQQGQTTDKLINPKWMAVVYIDDQWIRGEIPRMPSCPADVIFKGEISYEQRLKIDLKPKFSDGKPHSIKADIYAASFFEGWGDHPEDAWEWGHFQSADYTTPAYLALTFTLKSSEPSTPDSSDEVLLDQSIKHLIKAQDEWMKSAARANTVKNNPNSYWDTHCGIMESNMNDALYKLNKIS